MPSGRLASSFYDLAPILETAENPDYVRAQVRAMLEKHGHALDAPPLSNPELTGAISAISACRA